MSTTTLLKAITDFLAQERKLLAKQGAASAQAKLRAKLDATAADLQAHIQDYIQERSRPGTIRSILVAVDNSEPAEWALDEAVRLAEMLEARVSLVHVIVRPTGLAPELASDIAAEVAGPKGKALLRELAARVPAEYLDEQIVLEGAADKQIISAARKIGADLIVVGTHGRGPVGRFLLGSVADAVVRHAPCPVLTVGHPRDDAAPEPYGIDAEAMA